MCMWAYHVEPASADLGRSLSMLATTLTGNVTVAQGSKTVTGNSASIFGTELSVGMQLYVPNTFTGTSELEYAGVIDLVLNDQTAYLHDTSPVTLSAPLAAVITPGTTVTNTRSTQVTTNNVPSGFVNVVNHMLDAVNTGIFNNQQQVQTYHPPIADPKTGIPVNLPASTYVRDPAAGMTSVASTNLDQLGQSGSNNQGTVRQFDISTGVMGTSASNVLGGLIHKDTLHTATTQNSNNDVYTQTIKDTTAITSSDRYAQKLGINVARTTDNLADAKYYYNSTPASENLNNQQKQNLASNSDNSTRVVDLKLKKLVSTGVPVSIPGTMNLVNNASMPSDKPTVTPVFDTPQFTRNK